VPLAPSGDIVRIISMIGSTSLAPSTYFAFQDESTAEGSYLAGRADAGGLPVEPV